MGGGIEISTECLLEDRPHFVRIFVELNKERYKLNSIKTSAEYR